MWKNKDKDTGTLKDLERILRQHDMRLKVYACECCANPEITFWYKDKKIVESVMENFDMKGDNDAKEKEVT